MASENNSDFTTDAVPNPRVELTKDPVLGSESRTNEEEIPNIKRNPLKGFSKLKKYRIPTAQATIININNASGIHIGDQYVYNVNGRSEKPAKEYKETEEITAFKKSQRALETTDLEFVAKHMNECWKDTMRKLNFSEGEIEQYFIDHSLLGLKEVIFQLLLSWVQKKPEEATIGHLSSVLWNTNQQDVVVRMSKVK